MIYTKSCVYPTLSAATPDFHTDSHWRQLPLEPWWRFADENSAEKYRYLMRHE